MKSSLLLLVALSILGAGNAFAMAQSSTLAPDASTNAPPPVSTNRMLNNGSGWQASPPPGVSFMTGGIGRVSAPTTPRPSPVPVAERKP